VGTLSLALRGTADPLAGSDERAPPTVRTADLRLDGTPQAAPPARRSPPRRPALRTGATIEIIRGAEATFARVPSVG
jgi:hypothetical protein